MAFSRKLVRITQIDKGFIDFQNDNHNVLSTVKIGQYRVIETLVYTDKIFWLRVKGVMLLISKQEMDFTVIEDLDNG